MVAFRNSVLPSVGEDVCRVYMCNIAATDSRTHRGILLLEYDSTSFKKPQG